MSHEPDDQATESDVIAKLPDEAGAENTDPDYHRGEDKDRYTPGMFGPESARAFHPISFGKVTAHVATETPHQPEPDDRNGAVVRD